MLSQPIQNIIDLLSRNQTQSALSSINQLVQKDKKKQKLTSSELSQLQVLRAQVFVMEKHFGEAYQIFTAYLKKKDNDNWLLFLNINVAKELDQISILIPHLPSNDVEQTTDLYYLLIQDQRFADAAKLALKLYKLGGEKQHFFMFSYIYLNAEHQANKGGKFTLMFLDKLMSIIKLDKIASNFDKVTDVSLAKQIVKFHLEVLKANNDVEGVVDILARHKVFFQEYQQDLEHYRWVYFHDRSDINLTRLIQANLDLFRSHLKAGQLLTQNFDAQKLFVDFLFSQINEKQGEGNQQQLQSNLRDQLINSSHVEVPFQCESTDVSLVLLNLFASCYDLSLSTQDPNIFRSLCLTSLYIINQVQRYIHETNSELETRLVALIRLFFRFNGNKFSFTAEILHALSNFEKRYIVALVRKTVGAMLDTLQNDLSAKAKESSIIQQLNLKKLELLSSLYDDDFDATTAINNLVDDYQTADKALYQSGHLVEKGDRLTQDDYLLMAIDILIDSAIAKGSKIEQRGPMTLLIKSLLLIEVGLAKSPYNFDFLVRQNTIYSLLGLCDAVIDTTSRLDIKGVQFDTIGFLFAKSFLEIGATQDQITTKIDKALTFYQENLRESMKNLVSTLKHFNLDPFAQFYHFQNWIKSSYMQSIYLFVHAKLMARQQGMSEQSKSINIEWIQDKLVASLGKQQTLTEGQGLQGYQSPKDYTQLVNGKQTLSISADLLQSMFLRDLPANLRPNQIPIRCDYLGLYANPSVLLAEIRFQQLESMVKDDITSPDQVQELNKHLDLLTQIQDSITLQSVVEFDPHFQHHRDDVSLLRAQGSSLITAEMEDQFKYRSLYNSFLNEIQSFVLLSIKTTIQMTQFTLQSAGSIESYIQRIAEIDSQYSKLVGILVAHVNQFKPEEHIVPINLYKKINMFYSRCLPFTLVISNKDHSVKQKLFDISKKEKNDELKKKITELSKLWVNLCSKLIQQTVDVSKQLVIALKQQNQSHLSSLISSVPEEIPSLGLIQSLDLSKTTQVFMENLGDHFRFLNIRLVTLIEENLKLLK